MDPVFTIGRFGAFRVPGDSQEEKDALIHRIVAAKNVEERLEILRKANELNDPTTIIPGGTQ